MRVKVVAVLGGMAAMMAMFGTGVAAADPYEGQTYADASSAAKRAGLTPIVSTRIGQRLAEAECIVVDTHNMSKIYPGSGKKPRFGSSSKALHISLDCSQSAAS